MTKMLKIDKTVSDGTRDFLRFLLESKKVRGVAVLTKEGKSGCVSYSLITDPEKMAEAVPFYPVMPQNAGKCLSLLTSKAPFDEPVAVVLRPCEQRAFVELVKRQQGSLDNVITISSVCAGVYPLKTIVRENEDKLLKDYWSVVADGKLPEGIRDACSCCEHFVPIGADIVIPIAGEQHTGKECKLFANTEKGAELLKEMDGKTKESELETKGTETIRQLRQKNEEKMLPDLEKRLSGLDGLVEMFSTCIGCHGCRSVCPICYCRLCEFDSPRSEYGAEKYETELRKRGGVRIPPGSIAFQIGRMIHIGLSCVACGMCSDVCPVDIPVANIFRKTGKAVQDAFEYIPGKDIEDKIPVTTFEEDELASVED
ncbi:MAG: coenzyme F420 hydrogenase [Nitrospira bacterium SM23_35]|nr:MAG: coenzyme F420 hydrogenase [Nitrospira bacterium SM23_35]